MKRSIHFFPSRFLLLLVAVLATLAAPEAPARSGGSWFETRLGGAAVGYLHEHVEAGTDGGHRTLIEMSVVLNRMGSRVELGTRARFIESGDGLLQSVEATTRSSEYAVVTSGVVADGVLTLTSKAGGRDYVSEIALEQPLLGPVGARELGRRRLRALGDRIVYPAFSAELAAVAQVTREVTGSQVLEVDGQAIETLIVTETTDLMPVPTRYWLDADGRARRITQESPFGLVETVAADPGVRERVAHGGELPEEAYGDAVARSNVRLPRPRDLDAVELRIDLKRPDAGLPDLDGLNQTVLERSHAHAVIRVRRGPEPDRFAGAAPDDDPFLRANAYLQSDHPEVQAVARALHRPELDAYAQARVLQDWVHANMHFDAGIALLPASEAIRDRRGTCVAYAVVLSTLARALGIPSRVVMGHVYAANMWGGHAWSEVRIGDAWVELDAAIYRPGPADAARIAVIRTSLDQGLGSDYGRLARLYGNEQVAVRAFELAGAVTEVTPDAPAHRLEGRGYRNAWLGLAFRAPDGFAITEVDAMYPDPAIATLAAPDGRRIVIEQRSAGGDGTPAERLAAALRAAGHAGEPGAVRVAGRAGLASASGGAAAIAFENGSDLWLLHGTGEGVDAPLRSLAGSLRLDHRQP